MKKTHKEEVIEWINDWKEGLVNPPEPLILENDRVGFSILRKRHGGSSGILSMSWSEHSDSLDWHVAHTILRVDVWEEYKSWFTESTFGK